MYGLTCLVLAVNVFTMIKEQIHFFQLLYKRCLLGKNKESMAKYIAQQLRLDLDKEKRRLKQKKRNKLKAREEAVQVKEERKARK